MIKPFRIRSGNVSQIGKCLLQGVSAVGREYLLRRGQFLREPSRARVHHFRTAIRRLEAVLEMIEAIDPAKRYGRFSKQIDRELKALSELRDAQVQRKRLKRSHISWIKRGEMKSHLKDLAKDENRHARRVILREDRAKRSEDFARIEARLRDHFAALSTKKAHTLLKRLQDHLEQRHADLHTQAKELKPEKDKLFHHLRVAVKGCLYEMEFAAPLLETKPTVRRKIARLKDRLGGLQDDVAFAANARGYFKRSKAHPHPKRELRQRILREQKAILAHEKI